MQDIKKPESLSKEEKEANNKVFKIAISYPPLSSEKGTACLGQNRQFQWFNSPTYIYPMVPAYMATLLKSRGYDVVWDDAIAEEIPYDDWLKKLGECKPNLVVFESKTPVIKRHWKIINEIKKKLPRAVVVLVGDHVTALPEESMKNSKVDFIATGGDYDFLVLNIADHLNHAVPLEEGIWYRDGEKVKNTGHFRLDHDLDELPMIDRDLTNWKLYAFKNGNYKYTPGTYTYAARDCWWGRCTFCSWTTLYPGKDYRKRSAKKMLDEIGVLIEKYGVKEVMDDSGSFPTGRWLREFCDGMIERGYNKKIRISCNMRLKSLSQEEYNLMGKAGFRFILYGLESANQKTLDRINKNLKVEEIEKGVKMAKAGGLEPHITAMMGYPWETKKDAEKTIELAKELFKKGYVDTLQATIVIPYPGTPLFSDCQKEGLLRTEDWDRYDQREMVMKSPLGSEDAQALVQGLYKSFMSPQFILRKVFSIRNTNDVKFLFTAGMKWLGKMTDFKSKSV